MTKHEIEITPATTVHQLLAAYPEMEEKLIAMAAPFEKLRNPLLRKSIAKIVTLKNIASVGDIPLKELINNIRAEAGQPASTETYPDENYFSAKPDWFSSDKISISMVEGELGDDEKMTVVTILQMAKKLNPGDIIELTTNFLPAPGIDAMQAKGYLVWARKGEGNTIYTYFMKA